MGIFDRARDVPAISVESLTGVEQFARIVGIRSGRGRMKIFEIEIHSNGEPPYVVNTMSSVPRSADPRKGQDVAYRESRDDDSAHYQIEWDEPPRYGSPSAPSA
jgi:hypothetical protein